jgi:hypothetical protein
LSPEKLKGAQADPVVPLQVTARTCRLVEQMIVFTFVLGEYILGVDPKRNHLETRVATLELMLVTERARPSLTNERWRSWKKNLLPPDRLFRNITSSIPNRAPAVFACSA